MKKQVVPRGFGLLVVSDILALLACFLAREQSAEVAFETVEVDASVKNLFSRPLEPVRPID